VLALWPFYLCLHLCTRTLFRPAQPQHPQARCLSCRAPPCSATLPDFITVSNASLKGSQRRRGQGPPPHRTPPSQAHPRAGGRRQLRKGSRGVHALPGGWPPLPPAAHLRYCDAAFLCQLFFGFFTGVGVTEVGVKILVQDFCGLFTEVTPFPPETRRENHRCSSRCKQIPGRASWGGSDPCSTQPHHLSTLSPPGQPSTRAATPTSLRPARHGSAPHCWPHTSRPPAGLRPRLHRPCRGRKRRAATGMAGREVGQPARAPPLPQRSAPTVAAQTALPSAAGRPGLPRGRWGRARRDRTGRPRCCVLTRQSLS